jgi:hypothetical protein
MRYRIGSRWGTLSLAAAVAALSSCASRPDQEPGFEEEPGTVVGELVVRVADFVDGRSERMYFLRRAEGKEQRLFFGEHPDVEPGTKVKVWGPAGSDGIQVSKLIAAPAASGLFGSVSSELIGQPAQTPRVFCSSVVQINNGAIPTNLNVAATETQFHTGPKSVNAYLIENSFGKTGITGKTYGPFQYSMSGCDYSGIADAVKPQIPDKCDQYGFLLVPNQKACDWGGLGDEGTAAKPQSDTWYNAWLDLGVTAQEPGHNIGLNHASTITCTGGPLTDNLSTCKHDEYGDNFDTMGNGEGHMAGWPKAYQGWFGGCNVIKVTSSGTFNLLPLESACDGVQSIQIPFPGGKTRPFAAGGNVTLTSYYLEYRAPLGFDQGMTPGVFIRVDPNPLTTNTKENPHSWLLNASGNAKAPGLAAGGSFSDPAGGLTITVMAIDSQKATVQIDYPGGTGDPACMDGTTLTPPGPLTCTGAVTTDGGVVTLPEGGIIVGTGGSGGGSGRDAGRGSGGTGGQGGRSDGGSIGGTAGGAGSNGAGGGPGAGSTTSTGAAGVGTTGTTGSAGSPPGTTGVGTGGSSLGAGGSGVPRPAGAEDLQGGCSCRLATERKTSGNVFATLATGLLLSFVRRRRRAGAPG